MHLGEPRAATRLPVAIFRDLYVHTVHAVGPRVPKCLVRRGVCTAQARRSPRLLCDSLCFPASYLLSSSVSLSRSFTLNYYLSGFISVF